MIEKCEAVILHFTQHNDKTYIANAYTEEFGRIAFAVKIPSGRKGAAFRSMFYPFAILSIELEVKNSREVQRFKSGERVVLQSFIFDPIKSCITLFLADFFNKSLRDASPSKRLFEFLKGAIMLLDSVEDGKANFHLCFLFNLSLYLGLYPNIDSYREGSYFDMLNGEFAVERPNHKHTLSPTDSKMFILMSRMNFSNLHLFKFSRQERNSVLEKIIEYYNLHLGGRTLPSTNILREIFN